MEIGFQNNRNRRYILSKLREAKKNAEEHYIKKFNAFYQWNVGSLAEIEIKNALSIFFGTNETNEKIKTITATSKAFSLLIKTYKDKYQSKDPNSLEHADWLLVREEYEKERKKEYENTLGVISHNENIDNKHTDYSSNDEEAVNVYTNSVGYELEDDIDEEKSKIYTLQEDIQDLLDNIHIGNWVVKLATSDDDKFEYHTVIINIYVDEVILQKAVALMKTSFKDASFATKKILGKSYIDGYLNFI